MNRERRRMEITRQHLKVRKLPEKLTPVPREQWPVNVALPLYAWQSRNYLVQIWSESNPAYPEMLRMSVCRVKLGNDGRWQDGLTWDELHAIKHDIGYGDWYGVEVYPPDSKVVNVANMRHVFLMQTPLAIGWGL